MAILLGPDGTPIKDLADELEGIVADAQAILDTERRYRAGKPPRPSQRALRHRRENAAAKAKKRRRKQSRAR